MHGSDETPAQVLRNIQMLKWATPTPVLVSDVKSSIRLLVKACKSKIENGEVNYKLTVIFAGVLRVDTVISTSKVS